MKLITAVILLGINTVIIASRMVGDPQSLDDFGPRNIVSVILPVLIVIFRGAQRSTRLTSFVQFAAVGEIQKGTAGRGRENKCHHAPARPESYHGHGEWLHCLPGKWETTLLDPVFRLGLNQRLSFPAPGTGQQCGRTPPGGKRCPHILDPYGRHAACCTKGLHTRRHDRVRDLIAKLARQAGLTATTEQAMLIPDQIQEDGQPAPGSVRPIHRADVHIIEPQGSELWLDVKIHTVNLDLDVAKELLREEMTRCRAYGQREGYNLQTLDRGMTPVVLEHFGRTAPGAQAIFNRIINHSHFGSSLRLKSTQCWARFDDLQKRIREGHLASSCVGLDWVDRNPAGKTKKLAPAEAERRSFGELGAPDPNTASLEFKIKPAASLFVCWT